MNHCAFAPVDFVPPHPGALTARGHCALAMPISAVPGPPRSPLVIPAWKALLPTPATFSTLSYPAAQEAPSLLVQLDHCHPGSTNVSTLGYARGGVEGGTALFLLCANSIPVSRAGHIVGASHTLVSQ